jgi:hypothetical protein
MFVDSTSEVSERCHDFGSSVLVKRFFHVSSGPEWLLMIWQKQEERVRGGERLRRAVLAERQ